MKLLPVLLLSCVPAAFATSFTVTDPFGVGSPDVIGANSSFDIQKGEFDFGSTSATIRLYFNYGPNNTSLAPFNITSSLVLSVGDLFIYGPNYAYGVALATHNNATSGNVVAGTLYQINNGNGLLTASQVLGGTNAIDYRPNEYVWLRNLNGGLTSAGSGSVSVQGGGNGTSNPEFVVTINLTYSSTVGANLTNAPSIHFASATCGNDIMNGNVPEPATYGMIGAGLLLAAGVKFRKRNSASKN